MNNGYTIHQAAEMLEISPQRVRQLAQKMSAVRRVGNVIVLSIAQIQRMDKRNTKPGPRRNGAAKK